jgi:hypothetical protein
MFIIFDACSGEVNQSIFEVLVLGLRYSIGPGPTVLLASAVLVLVLILVLILIVVLVDLAAYFWTIVIKAISNHIARIKNNASASSLPD